MILRKIVQSVGYETEEAGDGREALEVLEKSWPVDLALVDWNMPEMNGLELVQAVRSRPEYASMQVMMVTTEAELERMQTALDAGANEYLMKPFDREALLQKLAVLGLDAG